MSNQTPDRELDQTTVTPDVGDEGGSPGDVELRRDTELGTGGEADETWRPADGGGATTEVRRDETERGRRSP